MVDEIADVQFGQLYLPDKYKSAWIVDGQHRLYGYSAIDPKYSKQNVAVIAFEGLRREDEARLFLTINHEQKTVPRTLLDELDADLKWGSSVPAERLASVAARIVQALTETVGGPLFRRVIAQGMKGDDVICLTMPEIKGGIVRSHLIGSLAQKRKLFVNGPLSADRDERTVKRAADAINLFFERLRSANPARWDSGRTGGFCINVGVRAVLLLFDALIKHAGAKRKNFDPTNASPEEIVEEVIGVAKPLCQFLQSISDAEFLERFAPRYGSGGPLDYFYELSQIVWEHDKSFAPEGLAEYLASKDDKRVSEAEDTIRFIETRVTEIVVSHFKKLHGNKYWNYLGTKEMRVKAYERQQEDAVEKQLDLEAYLDFIDKKKIVEKNYDAFKAYFDIPLRGEKGYVGFHLQVQYRVWHKVRKDGGSDGRGVGFYFRNVTELMLFGVRGKNARTLAPGRRQVNLLATRKREHSRKPDEQYALIEACSAPPYLELFARGTRKGWRTWGNEADDGYRPTWKTYAHHSAAARMIAAE